MCAQEVHSLNLGIGNDVFLTYATPMLLRRLQEIESFNARLKSILLRREAEARQSGAGEERSNLGGWHSEADLLSWDEPEIKELKRHFMDAVGQMMQAAVKHRPEVLLESKATMEAWVNINRNGDSNAAHTHPNFHWSGVYYVDAGKPDMQRSQNGIIEFYDPRGACHGATSPAFSFGSTLTFQPEAGMLLLFPSWHLHAVHPYFGEGERISIAFNARIDAYRLVPR